MLNLPEFVIFCTFSGALLLWYCNIRIACFQFQRYSCFALFPAVFWVWGIFEVSVFCSSELQSCSLHIVTLLVDPCLHCPPLIPSSSVSLLHLWPPHLLTSLISTLTLSGGGEAWAGPGPRPISPSLAAMCSSPEIITPSQWHHSNASLMID